MAAALGMGVLIGQFAVAAAARRAGRIPPADALREVAIEHPRPGFVRTLSGAAFLLGGVAMALVFSGFWAMVFAILGGMVLAMGVGLLGRWLLGVPAAVLGRAAPPARRRRAARRHRPGARTAGAPRRSRPRSSPVTMLVGIQGVVESSDQRHTEDVTASRVHASRVVVGSGGAPLPAATAAERRRLDGVTAVTAVVSTEVHPRRGARRPEPVARPGLSGAGRPRRSTRIVRGSLGAVRGDAVAVSRVFADGGPADGERSRPDGGHGAGHARVAAIYDRAAGLGDVLSTRPSHDATRRSPAGSALFVAGGAEAARSLAATRRTTQASSR